MKIIVLSITLLIALNHGVICSPNSERYKLEQLQILFRHGDRAADDREIYKNDPYDSIFKSIGYGQLTRNGMRRVYETGKVLRRRYENFLGDYKSEDVYAYSSYYDRAKMSLQLLLTGLYPPNSDSWNRYIHWQPIPINYDDVSTNYLTTFMCPIHEDLVEEARKAPEILAKLNKYSDVYEYITKTLDITIDDPFYAIHLHNNILAAVSLGLPLPDWCKKEHYKKLSEINALYYDVLVLTEPMKKILAGTFVERLLLNLESQEKTKVYLHGGHDFNIAAFTRAHNISNAPDIPYYGSALIVEKLRAPDDKAYVRFFILTGDSKKWIPLRIEQCGDLCPLSEYKELVQSFLPDDFARKCTTRTTGECLKSRT